MKKLYWIVPIIAAVAFLIAAVSPNVPLYVHWDGTIAAPTQFLNATFKAGANITFVDNGSNLTISSSASGAGSTALVYSVGADLTNLVYTVGANTTNHITISSSNNVTVAAGTNIVVETNSSGSKMVYKVSTSGTTTNQVYYSSLVQTAIPYASAIRIDGSYVQNVYHMTNSMTGHMTVTLTNLAPPQCITLVVLGSIGTYTNWNIIVTNDRSGQLRWLSLTNGNPTTTITSNQFIQFDFLAISGYTNTNVMSAWKETAR